jgi:hypothetical protein
MEIKPTYVTWEQAKWLKEKGFDVNTHMGYAYFQNLRKYKLMSHRESKDYSAPEQWQVIEWLRVNHSIWVLALPTINGYYAYKIIDVQLDPEKPIERPPYNDVSGEDYHTPQEAYSAAFDYILKELI